MSETTVTELEEADPRAVAAERMTFFADAVIAIAITLLALELPVPRGVDIKTNAQLWSALAEGRQEYLAFLISFVVIGTHWSAHHRIFRYVTTIGRTIYLPSGWNDRSPEVRRNRFQGFRGAEQAEQHCSSRCDPAATRVVEGSRIDGSQ